MSDYIKAVPPHPDPCSVSFKSNCDAALYWHHFGFYVIPILPKEKVTVVKWDPWLQDLCKEKIQSHWNAHQNHDVGFIVGGNVVVFDADNQQSIAALAEIEKAFDITPNLVVKTKKGCHHYFRLGKDVFAKTDSHSTLLHPERIDVKASRSMVVLPPSTGKELEICDASNIIELTEVGQNFIDAIARHNGRQEPRPLQATTPIVRDSSIPASQIIEKLETLLPYINPNCGYEDWVRVGMACFHESDGSEDGFRIWNNWSAQGSDYPGEKELRSKWVSFRNNVSRPVTMGSIIKMVRDNGFAFGEKGVPSISDFEIGDDTETIHPVMHSTSTTVAHSNPLDQYSLLGKSADVEKQAVEQTPVLGGIALKGQATVIYAAPNTGKTLIVLALIIESIKGELIDPSRLYYLNMDDNSSGLVNKLHLAEEYGFHMLAEGYANFEVSNFLAIIKDLIKNNQCRDVVIVLDTLKKFVDLMDKGKSSNFTKIVRGFVSKGGTIIALAHTNKNPGKNGKRVFSGTSDVVDDFDCAYMLNQIDPSSESSEKVVEFENFKRRGNVAMSEAYRYTTQGHVSYNDLLLSVQPVDPLQVGPLKQAEAVRSDAEVIATVLECLKDGINTKMKLADAVSTQVGISKRTALNVIERHSGTDPKIHRWQFAVGERGAKIFTQLAPTTSPHSEI